MTMWCLVSQPNNVVLKVEVDQKANGQECLDKMCELLGIIEKDYFGLQYQGPKGEHLWLNIRNRIDRQHPGPLPYQFELRVKFYVHPHMLLQESTRHQFYLQLKRELQMKTLLVSEESQLVGILSWMAQAEYGDQINDLQQFDIYRTLMTGIVMQSNEILTSIAYFHAKLRGKQRVFAEYNMIQEVAKLQNYGMEYHKALSEGSETVHVGVGPDGIFVCDENMEITDKYPYAIVKSAIHDAKKCKLYYFNEDGEEKHREFRMVSAKAAIALYRCMTEMHSFFKCDTINSEVFSQRTQDLKGILASIFLNDDGGQNYVFDVKHTSREVYDSTKRQLFNAETNKECAIFSERQSDAMEIDCCEADQVMDPNQMCQELNDKIEKLKESWMCRICMDNDISTTLCPCGHMICCSSCASQLTDCPLCRTSIFKVQPVFLPATMASRTS